MENNQHSHINYQQHGQDQQQMHTHHHQQVLAAPSIPGSQPHLPSMMGQHLQQHHQMPQVMLEQSSPSRTHRLTKVNRLLELTVHGFQAFVSLYAAGSIISTIRFQSRHGYTSMTALFLFFISSISLLAASCYMFLACWARTSAGVQRLDDYLYEREQRQNTETKHAQPSRTSWAIRLSVVLLTPRPRLWITAGLTIATLLASFMQWFKVRNGGDCSTVALAYRHFCQTTKGAVASSFLSTALWAIWLVCWSYASFYRSTSSQGDIRPSETLPREDIIIPMPQHEGRARTGEMREVHPHHPHPSDIHQYVHQSHQSHQEGSQHFQQPLLHHASQPTYHHTMDGGLQSDRIEPHHEAGPVLNNDSHGLGIGGVAPQQSSETSIHIHQEAFTTSSEGSIHSTETNSGPEISRSDRMRDHAKIFPRVRCSTTGSIQDVRSSRGTPTLYAREVLAGSPQVALEANCMSPVVSTPTTPLSRGGLGYLSNHTIKALGSNPRFASMGYIAAVNNMNANAAAASASTSVANSTQASPMLGPGSGPPSVFEMGGATLPRSHRSMSSLTNTNVSQSPAQAAEAERIMDEQLRAIRRRSFASEAMSPGGILPFSTQDQEPEDFSERERRSSGTFRLSFSSPSLGTLRRPSLGLKSVLTSMVTSPVSEASFSSASGSSSPSSSSSSPIRDPNESSSFADLRRQEQTLSAQDLLRLEYGDLYPCPEGNLQQLLQGEPNMIPMDAGVPMMQSRPRSGSVSSSGTTRSSSTTKTSSSGVSGSSGSAASTVSGSTASSNLTTLSNEDRRLKDHPGPPPSFLNRVMNNSHQSLRGHERLSLKGLRRGSSSGNILSMGELQSYSSSKKSRGTRSGNSTPVQVKFPSHGDLAQYSWDYRKEVPTE